MKMIIGGACQGQLEWARAHYPEISEKEWIDGKECEKAELFTCKGIYNFHEYIRNVQEEQRADIASELIRRNPEIILVSDEIGYGLVPIDADDRCYREQVGRICTELAAFSDEVVRVVMGIGTRIKGGTEMTKIELEQVLPQEIEKRSFEIITEELGDVQLTPGTELVVKRCIHTSADFDYAKNLVFSEGVIEHALKVLGSGATIVTDTQMAMAGVNKRKLAALGCQIRCFMSDPDVAEEAKQRGVTRAVVSMEHAAKLPGPLIFAIGNAPTALVHLYELVKSGAVKPELIIGVPVGFVNVVPSKELILTLEDVPYIVARGRKGGSNIAACICNALLYMMPGGR